MAEIKTTVSLNARSCIQNLRALKTELINLQASFSVVKDAFGATTEFFGKFTEVADLGGQLKSLSAQTGQSVRDLVLLRQAFKNVSLSADDVPVMAAKLQKALGGMSEDGDNTSEAFRKLGTSAQALKNLSFIDQLNVLSRGFSNITNQSQKAALAQQIFGRSGTQMLAVLSDSGGIAQAQREVGGMADLMNTNAEAFDSFGNHLATAKSKIDELAAGILSKLIPALDDSAKSLAESDLTQFGEKIGTALSPIALLAAKMIELKGHIAAVALAIAGMKLQPAIMASFNSFSTVISNFGKNFTYARDLGISTFSALSSAAKSAGVDMKVAMSSTGIGLLIVAVSELIFGLQGVADEARRVSSEMDNTASAYARLKGQIYNDKKTIIDQSSQDAVVANIGAAIQKYKDEKEQLSKQEESYFNKFLKFASTYTLAAPGLRAAGISPANLDAPKNNQLQQIQNIIDGLQAQQTQAIKTSNTERNANAEAIAATQKRQEAEAAALESRKKVSGDIVEMEKAKKDAALGELSPLQQQQQILQDIKQASVDALDADIARLRANSATGALSNDDIKKLDDEVKARTQIANIQKGLNKDSGQRALEQQEITRQNQLAEIEAERARIQGDTLTPFTAKQDQLRVLLSQERDELLKNIEAWEAYIEAQKGSGDPQINANIQDRLEKIRQAKTQLADISNEMASLDPVGQFQQKMVSFVDSFGTMTQQMADFVTNSIGSAISGVSEGLSGVIMGTESWGDAMRQTVGSILQSLIQVMLQMIVMNTVGKMLTAQNVATQTAAGAQIAAAQAPAAAAASVASFGMAPILGMAAAMAAIVAIMGLLSGGFEEGGLIPGAPSHRDNRLAKVATGEYVLRTAAVQKYGAGIFEAFNSLKMPRNSLDLNSLPSPAPRRSLAFATGGLVGDAGGNVMQSSPINIFVFDDRKKMLDVIKSTPGRNAIYDTMSKKKIDLGVST